MNTHFKRYTKKSSLSPCRSYWGASPSSGADPLFLSPQALLLSYIKPRAKAFSLSPGLCKSVTSSLTHQARMIANKPI